MENKLIQILKLALGATGLTLIIIKSNILVALGLFLFTWANNIDYEKKK